MYYTPTHTCAYINKKFTIWLKAFMEMCNEHIYIDRGALEKMTIQSQCFPLVFELYRMNVVINCLDALFSVLTVCCILLNAKLTNGKYISLSIKTYVYYYCQKLVDFAIKLEQALKLSRSEHSYFFIHVDF